MTEVWFRVEDTTYSAGVDECGDPIPGGPTRPNLLTVEVLRHTPCGAWVVGPHGECKFVNLSWSKRYALPTVKEAIVSYQARKRRQIQLALATIRMAEEAMAYLDAKGFYYDERKWAK